MSMSLKALRKIFKGLNPTDLPADLLACLAGDTAAIAANHAAYNEWDRKNRSNVSPNSQSQNRPSASPVYSPPHETTSHPATVDPHYHALESSQPPTHASLTISHLATNPVPRSSHPIPTVHSTNFDVQLSQAMLPHQTVHRTADLPIRGKQMLPDPSLTLCPTVKGNKAIDNNRVNWKPHLLFPELGTTDSYKGKATLINNRTHPSKALKAADSVQFHPLHHTAKGRINKKSNPQSGLGKMDVQSFVDVPLQLAEGQKILKLIGVSNIDITPNLMGPQNKVGPSSIEQRVQDPANPPPLPSVLQTSLLLPPAQPLKAQKRKAKAIAQPLLLRRNTGSSLSLVRPASQYSAQTEPGPKRPAPPHLFGPVLTRPLSPPFEKKAAYLSLTTEWRRRTPQCLSPPNHLLLSKRTKIHILTVSITPTMEGMFNLGFAE